MTEQEPNNNNWLLEESYALNNLGTLYFKNGEYKKASIKFDESSNIKQLLVDKEPDNSQFNAELADTLSWQASIYNKNNQLIDSLNIALKSLSIAKKLIYLEPENLIWKQRLGQAYYRLGLKNYDLGNLERAQEHMNNALPLFIQIHHNDTANQQWLKELLNSYILLAKINRHLGQLDDAIVNISQVETHLKLYSQDSLKTKDIIIQNLDLLLVKSQIYIATNKPKAAAAEFKKTEPLLEKLIENKVAKKWYFISYSSYIRSQVETANDSEDLAKSTLTLVQEYSEKMLIQRPDNKEYLALNYAINFKLNRNYKDQKTIDYLHEIKYNNPDYITH